MGANQPCLKELGVQERLANIVEDLFGGSPRQVARLEQALEHPCFKKRFDKLVKELAFEVEAQTPVRNKKGWMDVTLGNMPDVAVLRLALERAHVELFDGSSKALDGVAFVESKVRELVCVTVADLGYFQGATRKKVYEAAKENGLCLCPAEVGPQLRLQYLDQPVGERIVIGMEPILCDDGCLRVFMLSMGRVPNLMGPDGDSEGFWPSDTVVVFCRPEDQ